MRIWAFPSIYPFEKAGLQWKGIFAHRQYKGLIENGADLKVIIPVPWNPPPPLSYLHPEWKEYAKLNYPDRRMYDGITVFHPRIANVRPNRFVKKTYEERTIDAIIDFFKKNKITLHPSTDIIYSQWTPSSVVVQKAAHRLGIRSAILCIGDDVVLFPHEKPSSLEQFKKTWAEADMRFVVADYLGREANKAAGMSKPYDVVFMGVDYNYFKPPAPGETLAIRSKYNIPADKTVILLVGTASKRKGWIELFDALELVKKNDTSFFLVGVYTNPPEIDVYHEAEKRGLGSFFLGLNGISPDSLDQLYKAADIFCLPSHSEGMANVVIEAMSSGLAVITTDVGGHNEIVRDGENGILVQPFQHEVLASWLRELLTNTDRRLQLGRNARAFIVNQWGTFADTSKQLYKKLCSI